MKQKQKMKTNNDKYNFFALIIITFTLSILLCFPSCIYGQDISNIDNQIIENQKDNLNINDFIKQVNIITKDTYENIDFNNVFNSALNGNFDSNIIIKMINNILGKETLSCLKVISSITVIILIHAILNSITNQIQDSKISQITYYVEYILIVTIIMTNFYDMLQLIKNSIDSLLGFYNTLIPILMTLIMTTGNMTSTTILQPLLLFLITLIGNFINGFILPLTLISTVLAIISKVSDRIQLDKLAKFFKSSIIWILGIILTLFVGIVSLEGTLSSGVDGIAAKTTKAAVSSLIPVVGKILSDSVDSVLGCANILKNAVGTIGVLAVIGICALPILKLLILMISYYLASAICQPIAEKKIIDLLYQIGDTFKIFLAIICSLSTMLIIGVALVIKISNTSLMYR